MKKIGIIGTRRRDSSLAYKVVYDKFLEIYEEGDWIISGGCEKGGDRFAEVIAKKDGVPILIFYPNKKKGYPACLFMRNTDVATQSDVIIACVATDRTGGTEDTLKKFKKVKSNGIVYLV